MTGFGSGTAAGEGMTAAVEIRSVNNRFCEVMTRLPKSLQLREQEIKELLKEKLQRGKINLNISIERESAGSPPLAIDFERAKAYLGMIQQLKAETGLRDEIGLDTLLGFSDVITVREMDETGEAEWHLARTALFQAIDQIHRMRRNEGEVIGADLRKRIALLEGSIGSVETLSVGRREIEQEKLRERIAALISSDKIDPLRLELEIALLADKLDITEECVRFRSHLKFFLATLEEEESAGRKLNFLLQEMNREANTIGSKSFNAEIAHIVVQMKDEIERIREQIQNVE